MREGEGAEFIIFEKVSSSFLLDPIFELRRSSLKFNRHSSESPERDSSLGERPNIIQTLKRSREKFPSP